MGIGRSCWLLTGVSHALMGLDRLDYIKASVISVVDILPVPGMSD
jgi:hypothetical protein